MDHYHIHDSRTLVPNHKQMSSVHTRMSLFCMVHFITIPSTVSLCLLVSLCQQANAEMVPKIPSCHYMLLM